MDDSKIMRLMKRINEKPLKVDLYTFEKAILYPASNIIRDAKVVENELTMLTDFMLWSDLTGTSSVDLTGYRGGQLVYHANFNVRKDYFLVFDYLIVDTFWIQYTCNTTDQLTFGVSCGKYRKV